MRSANRQAATRAGLLSGNLAGSSRVRAVLVLGGVPWGDLEDAVQQVRLKLLESEARPNARQIEKYSAWLVTVASRVAVDWHRSRTRDEGIRDRLARRWIPQQESQPLEEQRVLALTVAERLEQLPLAHRQVLVLRYYADLTVPCIAAHLSIPQGTVKSRLHAAEEAMRESLRPSHDAAEPQPLDKSRGELA